MPPSPAAVKALMPGPKPMLYLMERKHAVESARDAASAPPIKNVIAMMRLPGCPQRRRRRILSGGANGRAQTRLIDEEMERQHEHE